VLDLARIEAGRADYEIQELVVDGRVAAGRPMVEPQLERNGASFTVPLDAGLVARVDREKTRRIVLDLLSNAAKSSPPAPHRGGQNSIEGSRKSLLVLAAVGS
jgi:signal transduction histidine kinase